MPDAAVFVATERGLRKSHQILVHRQSTDLETSREFMSYFQIARPNSSIQSIIRLICHGNNLIEGLELGNASDRPKNLVTPNTHPPVDTLEDCRLEQVSLL